MNSYTTYENGNRNKYIIDKENDNVYVNVILDHPDAIYPVNVNLPSVGAEPQIISYNVNKSLPILDKASDYYVSVIRFAIPLDTVPLMIMPIIPNQPDPFATPFIIGVRYLGVNYPIRLDYVPENLFPPVQQTSSVQLISPFSYVFSYQTLINMINNALTGALNNAGISAQFSGQRLAWFYFNSETNLIQLYVHQIFISIFAPLTGIVTIYINTPLSNYLDAFHYSFIGNNRPDGRDYEFILGSSTEPTPNQAYGLYNTQPVPPLGFPLLTVPLYWIYTQEYSVLQYWSSLRKIIISTNTIPISNEYLPIGIAQNNADNGIAASFPVLTDFIPQIEQVAGSSRSIAYYYPSGQYRLVDLVSDIPLQKMDIKLYWQDVSGNLYPLEISVSQQASVKIAFLRKTLYKNTHNLLK